MFRFDKGMTRTKIIATVGPSSDSYETLKSLVLAGASGFRLNYSHGNFDYFKSVINRIRELEEELNVPITILGDLQGPTIRIGDVAKFVVNEGDEVEVVFSGESHREGVIPIPERKLFDSLREGDIILVDDGKVEIKVVSVADNSAIGEVVRGGEIRSRVTVAVKGKEIDLPTISERDLDFIKFSVENDVDILAVSFVKSKESVVNVRGILEELGGDIKIYSKIETISAIENLDEIVKESDGVIIARGDLGAYYPLETIPRLQSLIVEKCLYYGKPSVLATQILESMIKQPMPTRAEITDIYIGVMESVDAMLLSGETAIGLHPVESVSWLRRTIIEAEKFYEPRRLDRYFESVYDKFVKGIVFLAEELGAKIIAYTKEGQTARRIARYRPKTDVFVFTNNRRVINQINLLYGVYPFYVEEEDIKEALDKGKSILLSSNVLRKGNIIIKTAGLRSRTTDIIEVEEIS